MPEGDLCGCSVRLIKAADCAWVENFIPFCSSACYEQHHQKKLARAARDVPVGQPWTFKHKTMADIIRIEEGADGRLIAI